MCPGSPSRPESRLPIIAAAGLIILAAVAAYYNSLHGPFVFDDTASISNNATIRRLWPPGDVLNPPTRGETVSSRPVVNLSLAINYAFGGLNVWGYHVVNLAIHALGAMVLFGIARRTLLLPGIPTKYAEAALGLALAIALVWVVHPLTTAAVTYVIQRAESIVSLFYLLTLYCVLRGAQSRHATAWFCVAAVACLLGMASKEVMVTAPVVILLYDRSYLTGSFRESLRRRWELYAALATTWASLMWLVASTGGRGDSAGLDTGVSPGAYAATQFVAVVRYLRVSLWPDLLVFDYGTLLAGSVAEVVPAAALVVALLVFTLIALMRWPRLGFLPAAFFLILSPTSTFVPIATQTIAEHRMYLPLACLVALGMVGCFALCRRLAALQPRNPSGNEAFFGVPYSFSIVVLFFVVALTWCTMRRNEAYQSRQTLWQDTLNKRPQNERAHNNLGNAFMHLGRTQRALVLYQNALRIKPDYAEAHKNLGAALQELGRPLEAITHFRETLRIEPANAEAHYNWGLALQKWGRYEEAIDHYQDALRIDPNFAKAHFNLGNTLQKLERFEEAVVHYQQALQINPDNARVHHNLAVVFANQGRFQDAINHLQHCVRLDPDNSHAREFLNKVRTLQQERHGPTQP